MSPGESLLSFALWDLTGQFGRIFYTVVLPILLLAGVGFVSQRRMRLDLATLTRLNFCLVIPAMIYTAILDSRLTAAAAGEAVGFCIAMIVGLGAVSRLAAWVRRVPADYRNSMTLATISYNSGNYGVPLQQLAFSRLGLASEAVAFQSLVMITQNLTNFTVGILLAASGRKDRHWRENLLHIVRFPPIYALAAALLTVQIRRWLGPAAAQWAPAVAPFWATIRLIRDAFVPIALFTLGAQLAHVRHDRDEYPVKLTVFLRLLVGPALGLGLVWLLGLHGLLAQVMLISTSTPTAVNAMLLTMEFGSHPNYLARCVFYSTLLSPITVTLVVFFAQSGPFAVTP